jgi:hypothetical protein
MLAIPLAVLAAGTAQAASVPCASASGIDAMLDEGPYVPGEAIVVVDATKALHTEAIADATELMQADAQSYAEATGEEARSGAGVVIEHVVREGPTRGASRRACERSTRAIRGAKLRV